MQLPKISIITVVYNDAEHIVETMDSVINQSYENIEYILIDGGSNDGTKEIIESRLKELGEEIQQGEMQEHTPNANNALDNASNTAPTLNNALDNASNTLRPEHINPQSFYLQTRHKTKPNFSFKFLSEKDSGIYDAMNKGILLATGEWCNFMNCGDRFYNLQVLKDIVLELDNCYAIVDGGIEIVYDENHKKIKYYQCTFNAFNIEFCHHQASFIQTSLLKKYYYDTSFKILGDTNFFASIYLEGKRWKKIKNIIAVFNTQGISQQINLQHFNELKKIVSKKKPYYPLTHTLYYLFYIIPRVYIRKTLPKSIANAIRQRLR